MKKIILIIVVLLIAVFMVSTYFIEKYPDYQISLVRGYYKNTAVLDLFEYEDKLIYVLKSYERAHDAFDDDNCYDDMLIYAVTDLNGNVISTKEVSETLTVDNDGDGIRSGENKTTSAQYNQYVYSSVNLYGDNFFIIYDSNDNTYEIVDTVYFYESLIIDQHLKGVTLFDNGHIQIDYVEYSLSCELLDVTHIGYLDQPDQSSILNQINPIITTDYIVVAGDIVNRTFGYNLISIYNINTEETEVIAHSEDEFIDFWKIDSQIFYGKSSINEGRIDIYDIESTFIEEKLEDEIDRPSSNTYVDISETPEWFNNQVVLLDKDGNQITLEFKSKTYVEKIYEFGDDLYLVVRVTPGSISQIVNGTNFEYIIHYKIGEDHSLNIPN
jgi:hypothetical protein